MFGWPWFVSRSLYELTEQSHDNWKSTAEGCFRQINLLADIIDGKATDQARIVTEIDDVSLMYDDVSLMYDDVSLMYGDVSLMYGDLKLHQPGLKSGYCLLCGARLSYAGSWRNKDYFTVCPCKPPVEMQSDTLHYTCTCHPSNPPA